MKNYIPENKTVFIIRGKLSVIRCYTSLSVLPGRTESNPVDFNRFQSHTEKKYLIFSTLPIYIYICPCF